MKIGFIGLGAMGKPIAINLINKGAYSLIVNELNQEDVRDLVSLGAVENDTPSEVAKNADIIITMLPDSTQVEAVSNELLENLNKDKIYIDMSTIDPKTTRK